MADRNTYADGARYWSNEMDDPRARDARRRPPPDSGGGSGERSGNRYALAVGINDYGGVHPTLQNAVKDAQAIADRLRKDFGFSVTCLIDREATADAIRAVLTQWEEETQSEDDVLVFFSGHGTNRSDAGGQLEGYLIPATAGQDPDSWLSEAEIIQRAKNMPALRIFLVFDACYSGTALRLRDDIQPGARDDQVLKILVAGTEKEPVLDGGAGDHSIFTKSILEGLDGLADVGQQPDGVVAAGELIVYVRSEVPWRSRLRGLEQTPVGGALQGTAGGQDFEFRRLEPRLPASLLRNLYSREPKDRIAAAQQLIDRKGTATADQAAKELLHLVRNDRVREGDDVLSASDLLDVQQAAVEALGALGHPAACETLIDLLQEGGERALRIAAASALGTLVQTTSEIGVPNAEREQQAAIHALIETLEDGDPELREAAKMGLSRVPASAGNLAGRLEEANRTDRAQLIDALACIALHHPEASVAWPGLDSPPSRLLRRYYLLRRRLIPQLSALWLRAAYIGIAGAIGLALAYLMVTMIAFKPEFKLYGPAVLTICALPGALAGIAYATVPTLTRTASRYQDTLPALMGGLLAGLGLGLAMAVPNWFLAIGCGSEGCPPHAWLLWLLPGLLIGPVVGVAMVSLLDAPGAVPATSWTALPKSISALGGGTLPRVLVALICGLAFALTRIPLPLSIGRVEPHWIEVILWGLGGFLFGLALATGWSLTSHSVDG